MQYLAVRNVLVGLHEIYHAADVRPEPLLNVVDGFRSQIQVFGRAYLRQEPRNNGFRQLVKPHSHEFRLQRVVYFTHVVAYQAKFNLARCVFAVAVQQVPQRNLRVLGHVINLVQNNEFKPVSSTKQRFRVYKRADLVADHVDPAFVRRVQVNDGSKPVAIYALRRIAVLGLVSVDDVNYGGRLARPRRSVEQ